MYIIIVGLGGIGRTLVGIAADNRNDVVVIDKNEERAAEILEHYDVLAVVGDATDTEILEEAGIERADALVATTSDDSVNLMTCLLARRYKVPNVISIVNQIEHSDFFKEVGVRISENPDELVAMRLYYWVESPGMQQLAALPGGRIFEFVAEQGAPFIDRELRELKAKNFVVIAINRAGNGLIIPTGDTRIRAGDTLTVFTKKEAEKETLSLLGRQLKHPAR
ncbi:MAG: TrkA family potassium uptake protein [Methanomicrobiales archaeon]|nr:TrkA family potassium uptake protein [Methanomicrobiales archaeon]MDI6876663.1 TrkA family potassium uptake protein [Methanomicrobiales archaeon]